MRYAILATTLALAACGGGNDAANNGAAGAGAAGQEEQPANLTMDPGNAAVPVAAPSPAPLSAIPADYVGRWGLVDNDCVPGRADAKGLMIVAADGLGFYESRAAIEKVVNSSPGTLTLDLSFTGEGQQWNRRETLTLLDGGRTLVRAEQKPAGSFRYIRCPAGKEAPTG